MLPRIVFHHVHKCAGTTLLKYLEGTAAPERSAFVEALVAAPDPHGTDRVAALVRTEFIHDPFGVHDWKTLLGNAVDVIFLRDPVERLHSEWRMIARWDDALVDGRDSRYRRLRDVARRGFAPFLALPGAAAFGNAVACHLAFGDPVLGEVHAACDAGGEPAAPLLDLLDARLAAIDVVGFVETFDDSFAELVARLGCAPPRGRVQVHNVHAASQGVSAEERRLAEACTVVDRRLFDAARRRAAGRGREDRRALEEAATARHDAAVLAPPDSLLVDMGEGIRSDGWHPCEVNGRKRARWTGPGPRSALHLRIDRRRPLALRVRVGNHLRSAQVDRLQLLADGVPLATDHWVLPPFDHLFEATIPPAPDTPPRLVVELDCAETHAPPDRSDTRLLGVEVEEVEVGPSERYSPRSLESLARVRRELDLLAATVDGDRRLGRLLGSLPDGV